MTELLWETHVEPPPANPAAGRPFLGSDPGTQKRARFLPNVRASSLTARTEVPIRPPAGGARQAMRSRSVQDPLIEVRLRSDRLEDELSALFADPRAGVRLVACRSSPHRSGRRLVRWLEFETESPVGRERLRELTRRAAPDGLSVANAASPRTLVRLSSPLPGVCAAVFAAGAVCTSCPLLAPERSDRATSVRLIVPRNGDAQRLRRELSRRLEGHFTIERTGELRSSDRMTARQEQAFRTALELGYFSYPRRTNLGALARRLGVSRSTALELLRRSIQELGRRRFSAGERSSESI